MVPILNYKHFPGPGYPLVLLHGLFGSLDNWVTLARHFSTVADVFVIDQRNHGRSPHTSTHTYPELAADLLAFLDQHNLSEVDLLGHSMGGKTVMEFSVRHPDRVRKLIVADMANRAYKGHHQDVFDALFGLNLSAITSRREAEAHFNATKIDESTRQFLLKNLDRGTDGAYSWKFNLNTLYREYPQILAGIESPFPVYLPSWFIRGGRSDYVKDRYWPDIEAMFPLAECITIDGAGHWVHAERPVEFSNVVLSILQR